MGTDIASGMKPAGTVEYDGPRARITCLSPGFRVEFTDRHLPTKDVDGWREAVALALAAVQIAREAPE